MVPNYALRTLQDARSLMNRSLEPVARRTGALGAFGFAAAAPVERREARAQRRTHVDACT